MKDIIGIILFSVILVALSIGLHEFVHYLQQKLSAAVEPDYLALERDSVVLYFKWTTDDNIAREYYISKSIEREIVAYSVQALFIIAGVIWHKRKFLDSGVIHK